MSPRKQPARKSSGDKMAAKKHKTEPVKEESGSDSTPETEIDPNDKVVFTIEEFIGIIRLLVSRLNDIKMMMDAVYGNDSFEKIFGTSDLVLLSHQLTDTLADERLTSCEIDLPNEVFQGNLIKKKIDFIKSRINTTFDWEQYELYDIYIPHMILNRRKQASRPLYSYSSKSLLHPWQLIPAENVTYAYSDIDHLIRFLRLRLKEIKIKMRQEYGDESILYIFGTKDTIQLADKLTGTYKAGSRHSSYSSSESDFDETEIKIEPEIKVEPEDEPQVATTSKNDSQEDLDQVICKVYAKMNITKIKMRTMFGKDDVIFKKFFGSADVTQVTAMLTGLTQKRIQEFVGNQDADDESSDNE